MEHMSNIFSTSFGINFAKLTRVWLALISLTAKINSLLFWSHPVETTYLRSMWLLNLCIYVITVMYHHDNMWKLRMKTLIINEDMMMISKMFSINNHGLHVSANCCKGRLKKYRKWHFWDAATEKPLNRSTHYLEETIT